MNLTRADFDAEVEAAIALVDPDFRRYFEEVPVIVEDEPTREVMNAMGLGENDLLLGLFHGQPLNARSVLGNQHPSHIVLYRRHILAVCRTRAQVRAQVRKTLVHELGHYLGFSEAQLRARRY